MSKYSYHLSDGAKWWRVHQFHLPGGYHGCQFGALGEESAIRVGLLISKVGLHLLAIPAWSCAHESPRRCYTCFLDLTLWNLSCSLRVFQTDPSQSAWCLTPCWPTTLEVVPLNCLVMERRERDPTSTTAFCNLLKQAVTRQYCSWNCIIGR